MLSSKKIADAPILHRKRYASIAELAMLDAWYWRQDLMQHYRHIASANDIFQIFVFDIVPYWVASIVE
jgi:hypothetical protein